MKRASGPLSRCSQPDGGADDVDDGVDGADFVEVHLLDGHGVDVGFGLAEKLKGAGGAGLYCMRRAGRD